MRILIVGAGYVGSACARALSSPGNQILCLVRTEASAAQLQHNGFQALACDVALEDFRACTNFKPDAILYCPSTRGGGPEEYRLIHQQGLARILRQLAPSAKFCYTSSTSVYSQTDGSRVDENTDPRPSTESAQILREAEKSVLTHGGTVLRLAGIYGPGRSVLLGRFLEGTAVLPAEPGRYLNLIHQDDIVSAFMRVLTTPDVAGRLYNVADDHPATYHDIYSWLAARLGKPLPLPGEEPASKRGLTNKQVLNIRLRALGWTPRYPDFRAGFEALLKEDSNRH